MLVAPAALAADVPVDGTRVSIRRRGDREKLVFFSRDAAWTLPSGNGATPGGLRIDVSSPAHPEPRTLHLPDVAGRPGWTAGVDGQGEVRRYEFRNPSAPNGFSDVYAIAWTRHASFKLVVRAGLLDPSGPQGGFRIRISDADNQYCARFDAATVGSDTAERFSARNAPSAGLVDCSPASLGEPATTPCSVGSGGYSCGGSCASDETCFYQVSSNDCQCDGGTGLPCGESGPVCNGYCPVGTHCGGVFLQEIFGRGCGCVPDETVACNDSEYPTCGGSCSDPAKVCRPLIFNLSIAPTAQGCACMPPGDCFVDGPGPGPWELCGPGADCPPGTVCDIAFGQFGCFAQCVAP